MIDKQVVHILDKAREGCAPGRKECIHILGFPESSAESSLVRVTADALMRERYGNESLIFAQIGIETAPCPGNCRFCVFAEDHTPFEKHDMPDEEILVTALNFTESNEIFALFLMTMHDFQFDRLCRVIDLLRNNINEETKLCVNIGDFDNVRAEELKAAGVSGVYHLARLREGIDTSLDPKTRIKTIQAIKNAGMDWYYCCEPIGPEHTPEELADEILLGREYGCYQHGAMRRVHIPLSSLARYGEISELRLGQITAVVSLAMLETPETKTIGVHEPNLIGLTSGANTIYAETGSNPRDMEKETSGHRGRDIAACKQMLRDAGFSHILTSPGVTKDILQKS